MDFDLESWTDVSEWLDACADRMDAKSFESADEGEVLRWHSREEAYRYLAVELRRLEAERPRG